MALVPEFDDAGIVHQLRLNLLLMELLRLDVINIRRNGNKCLDHIVDKLTYEELRPDNFFVIAFPLI